MSQENPIEASAVEMRSSLKQWSSKLSKLYKDGKIDKSTHYLLPLLSLRGSPMTLSKHYMFKPLFRMPAHGIRPRKILYKTARQVGKTTNFGAADILNHIAKGHYCSLTVTPLYEQMKKISTEIVRPMIKNSKFYNELLDKNCKDGVMVRTFKTGGTQYFSHAYRDSIRIRSTSGVDQCNIDEVQHIIKDHIPVILETMSARPQTQFINYTGTPLSFANPIEGLWKKTTQCEWVIKCQHCGHYNIPNTSHHLYKMIGKKGLICGKNCGKPIDPVNGAWVSPVITNTKELWERMHEDFAGFHVPQLVHPLHCYYPSQWKELINKMEGDYTPAKFLNEVCGESYDSADRMLSLAELGSACCGNKNREKAALKTLQNLDITAMGIDWTGGGEDSESYTKFVIGGCPKGSLDVKICYMETLPKHWDVIAQMQRLIEVFKTFRPRIIAHDYQGVGHVYEPFLLNMGIPQEKIWNMAYTTAPTKPILYYNDPSEGNRDCINMDRTRSLALLYNMIKANRLIFPSWESLKNPENPNETEVDDFLSMHGEEIRRPSGHNVYIVQTDPELSDDYVHATNFLAGACWFLRGEFPSVNTKMKKALSDEDLSTMFKNKGTLDDYLA